jgi:hypothetical protein
VTAATPAWPSELNTRYELLEEAGRGGMGVVYRALGLESLQALASFMAVPLLAPFGGIVIYDADGKPVPAK